VISTQFPYIFHTQIKGFVWRRRYPKSKSSIEISLRTHDRQQAEERASFLNTRWDELAPLNLEIHPLKVELYKHRDEMLRRQRLGLTTAPVTLSDSFVSTSNTKAYTQKAKPVKTSTKAHSLRSVMAEYMEEKERDWKLKTSKENRSKLEAFLSFCKKKGVNNIEDVTKPLISSYKLHMDALKLAPLTKQLTLEKISPMFKFAQEMRDYITTNPFSGMQYKKAKTLTTKEEITPSQYCAAMGSPSNQRYTWLLAVFYHTGMRRNEIRQLTKADYREIDGVKCISINTDNGKSVKNESSIRNIPLNNALLELGVWEEKPTFRIGDRTIDVHVGKSFEVIGLKRTTHCFRHSLSNRLRDHNIQDSTRAFILGHTQILITDRVYATRSPLLQMKAALDLASKGNNLASKGSNMTGSV